MNYMRIILLLFFLLIGLNSVLAYDLVLPKDKKTCTNSNYAFFVGKAAKSEDIIINDEKIFTASNGAFAHSVKLKEGENRIIVKSNFNTQVYKFYKSPKQDNIKPKLIEYEPKLYKVKKDNVPLRKTPVDYGMNRISHLFKDTNLLIDGEIGSFYRVRLSKLNEAWIAKEQVYPSNEIIYPGFLNVNTNMYKNASVHEISFTEKLPYTIDEESDEIIFKVFNPFANEDSIYTVNIKKYEKYSYKINLNEGKYIIKLTEYPIVKEETLEGLTIVIDPGHGGSEKGAVGCLGDLEKDINLRIGLFLKEFLSLMGANVIITRECDGNISLEDRVKLAKDNDANIFVSIHLNSIPDIKMDIHKNRGTSVYYYNKNSKELAKLIQTSVCNKIETREDGVKTASFAVLRPTDYIGVLVEVAYMTNPIDSIIYTKDDFAINTAKAILDAIVEYSFIH